MLIVIIIIITIKTINIIILLLIIMQLIMGAGGRRARPCVMGEETLDRAEYCIKGGADDLRTP